MPDGKVMTISVIIPTYQRPKFLLETMESVWAQTRLPDEILIGDDSPDDETERLVQEKLISRSSIPIRYFRNSPALREARNVNALYRAAGGSHILHLHDDDPILPCCVEVLAATLEKHPATVAAFGQQHITKEDGTLMKQVSEAVNRAYFRTPEREGIVDGFFACAVSMFPNNGFLIETKTACEVGYDDHGAAGSAVDYYFGLRLGQLRRPMVFVNEHTATVRMTALSESRRPHADNSYQRMIHLLASLEPQDITPDMRDSIRHHLFFAISNAAKIGKPTIGWKWFFSPYFRLTIPTVNGAKCGVRLAISSLKLMAKLNN